MVKIEGAPYARISHKRSLIAAHLAAPEEKEAELLELENEAEMFIESIEDGELRAMLRLRYIDGLKWLQVAARMNELYPEWIPAFTEDSCRIRDIRFSEKTF